MKVLGISCYFHDASCCLWIDGKLSAYALEERFSRIKHDASFPQSAIDFCLQQAGLSASDIDHVVFYELPSVKFLRILKSVFRMYPFSFLAFKRFCTGWVLKKFWILAKISHHLNLPADRVHAVPHHGSHAFASFLMSDFNEAAVLVVDGVGEEISTSIHSFRRHEERIEQKVHLELDNKHSLGLFYAAFTAFLGFKVNDGECSIMALAAYGKPIYKDKVSDIFALSEKGFSRIKEEWLNFDLPGQLPYTQKFLSVFGAARPLGEAYHMENPSTRDQYFADIAASVQVLLEEQLLALAKLAAELTGAKKLCLSGGVSLNCVAVEKLENSKFFQQVYCPYDPGDGAASVGGAAAFLNSRGKKVEALVSPYVGPDVCRHQAEVFNTNFDWKKLADFHAYGAKPFEDIVFTEFSSADDLVSFAVEKLCQERIVGWFQGRAEMGPRALGARSLLALPSVPALKEKLNHHIKKRPSFRPYGISVLEEEATQNLKYHEGQTNAWMQSVVGVHQNYMRTISSAVHIDGTTRPHIVRLKDNPLFFDLLKKLQHETGSSAVLNTSFNESGEPIVNDPLEALQTFLRTDIDVLLVGNCAYEKIWRSAL